MSTNLVNGWDQRLFIAPETALGTLTTPANAAAYAAWALEAIEASLGVAESGVIRDKQDRSLGRGMRSGFVEGRVEPIPFNVTTSLKSRAAADTSPHAINLFKAAGLKVTTNAGVSVVLTPSATPVETGDFASATLRRVLGSGDAERELETLAGCVVRQVSIEGGDKEVMLGFQGVGRGPKQTQGGLDSITLADDSGTTLTTTADASYSLAVGYYQCESEIIYVSAVNYGTTSHTIARAQLGSTGAAHSAKPLTPYIPAGIAYTGAPISEALTTNVTLDGNPFRCTSWSWVFQSGLDLLTGETGSKYSQGVVTRRMDLAINLNLILKGDDIRLFNKATQRKLVAVSMAQGTAAGGIITLSSSYCEVVTPEATAPANDPSAVSLQLRIRDDAAGNNMFSITLT